MQGVGWIDDMIKSDERDDAKESHLIETPSVNLVSVYI